MRIVCDACQAKYSISDDKVVGKVFKIRCKKCSNIIVVRGGAQVESAPAPALPDPPSDAIWHVVIDQDQVGPLTIDELQQRIAANEIDGETFAWREGMPDWLPLAQIDELAALTSTQDKTAHDYRGGSGADAIHALAAAGNDAPNDELFAARGARGGSSGDDELFAARGARAGAASMGTTEVAAGPKLRAERNESSVLFSLNNLAQIANKPPPAATPPSGTATTGAGEGSGLIDIRSMASAYMGTAGAATKTATASSSIGTIDDLPVFGGGGFSEPAVIVPSARPANNQRVMVLMIGALAVLAAVAIVLVVILLNTGKSDPKPDVVATIEPKHETPAPAPPAPPAQNVTAQSPPSQGSNAVSPPAEPKHVDAPKHPAPETPKHVDAPKHQVATNDAPKHVDAKQPDPPKTTTKDECDQVTCAFNGNEAQCCAKWRAGHPADPNKAKTPPSDLPDALDVGTIQAGIGTIKPSAMRCGDKSPAKGKVKVHLKVGADGRVGAVNVESSPDPALGACVQSATQNAKFAKTQRGGSFSYVFSF